MPAHAPIPAPPVARNERRPVVLSKHAAVAVLLLGLGVTLVAWWQASVRDDLRLREQFHSITKSTQEKILVRMLEHEAMLRGAIGMISAMSRLPTQAEWRNYVESLGIAQGAKGVQGLGLAVVIRPQDLAAHEQSVRSRGMPAYRVWPQSTRGQYTSIVYLEPFDERNQRALGYDMYSEPIRRAAMDEARDTGAPALSGIVRLVQETGEDVQPGFLLYMPVYRPGRELASVAQRRAALLGYIYSPFRATNLVRSTLGWTYDGKPADFNLRIQDGDTRLFDSAPLAASGSRGEAPALTLFHPLQLPGRTWMLQFDSRPEFEAAHRSHVPKLVALGGILLSLLMFGLLWAVAGQRDRVAARARLVSRELRENRTMLEAITESAHDAILSTDHQGLITYLNPAAEQLFGVDRRQTLGTPLHDLLGGADALRGSGPGSTPAGVTERLGRRRNGTLFPIELSMASWQTAAGPVYSAIVRDITERRNAEERMRLIIDAAPSAMLMVNADGAIVLVNLEAQRLFGYRTDELLEQRVEILIPDELRARHRALREHYAAAPDQHRASSGRELTAQRKDGSRVPVEVGLNPMMTAAGRFMLVSVVDISERKQAERRMEVENAVAQILAESESAAVALPAVIRTLAEAYGWDCGAYWRVDQDRRTIRLSDRWTGGAAPFEALYASTTEMPVTPGTGSAGITRRVWETDAPYWIENVQGGGFLRAAAFAAAGIRSGVAFPINIGKERLGVVELFSCRQVAPQESLLAALASFGVQVAHYCKRKQAEHDLWMTATHDTLTGLPNRAMYGQALTQAFSRARRQSQRMAVMFVDLDRFKTINDTLGHEAGDAMLQGIAQRLRRSTRDTDTVARFGGDEFVVLVEQFNHDDEVGLLARRILRELDQPVHCAGHDLHATASIGISVYPQDGADPATLLKNADIAMYRAKEEGRNNFKFYSVDMSAHSVERLSLEEDLRQAVVNGEFLLHFQPKADLLTGQVTGLEALIRWQSPTRGMVAPGEFIPIAEESGLILPIGRWALTAACLQLREWQLAGLPLLRVAVNLSAYQFTPALVAEVRAALGSAQLDAEWLEIEVTESMIMRDPAQAAQLLADLRDLGIHIAMDDFGSGYSSLGALKHLPLDTLKVDRSFIRDLPDDPGDDAICRAIVAMANALQLRVVAEGVETAAQREFLRRIGCHEMQGYLLSRPLAADDVAAFLACAAGPRLRQPQAARA